jgi:DNA-binding response OmpR family regulator
MEVLEAADGVTGLALARAESPDVILLDVMMDGLDGWEVAAELIADERTRSAAIVFLTGRAELRERLQALGIGRFAFVTKPFDPADLIALVAASSGPSARARSRRARPRHR